MSYYTGKIGTQPPDTNWIRCPCCHLKFSSRSLPFHIEACIRQKSGSWEILTCPVCNDQVKGSDFKLHLTQGCVFRHTSHHHHDDTVRAPRAGQEYDPHMEVTTTSIELVPCPHCERRFATHRLSKHTAVCSKQSTTPKRKVFDTKSKRTPLRGPPSVRWSQPPAQSFNIGGSGNRGRTHRSNGRSSSPQLAPAMPAARGNSGKVKLTVGNTNATSLGNTLVRGRRAAPRETYHHY